MSEHKEQHFVGICRKCRTFKETYILNHISTLDEKIKNPAKHLACTHDFRSLSQAEFFIRRWSYLLTSWLIVFGLLLLSPFYFLLIWCSLSYLAVWGEVFNDMSFMDEPPLKTLLQTVFAPIVTAGFFIGFTLMALYDPE